MKICLFVKRIFRVSSDMITIATGADMLGNNGRRRVKCPQHKAEPGGRLYRPTQKQSHEGKSGDAWAKLS